MYISRMIISIFLYSFKDQSEGANLLELLRQINLWPTEIFDELKYDSTD